MRYRLSSTIPAPIERVFVGTVFRYDRKGKPGWMVVEITEFDRPHSFVTTATMDRKAPESGRLTFEEHEGVTRVSTEAHFQLPSWLPLWVQAIATPLAFGFIWPMLVFGTWYGQRLARRALL
jgi:hypothetical protein